MGLTNYYSRLIDNYAALAAPLNDLKKTDVVYDLLDNPVRLTAFNKLKESMCSPAVMIVHPDFSKPFRVECDASNEALGAALLQEVDALWRPVCYASRRTRAGEIHYAPMKLECLAMVYALNQFRPYIFGVSFDLVTDQSALPWLFNETSSKNQPRDVPKILANWMMNFEDFKPFMTIVHRAGTKQVLSDALSRLTAARDYQYAALHQVPQPVDSADDVAACSLPPGVGGTIFTTYAAPLAIFSDAELSIAQRADTDLRWCYDFLELKKVVPSRSPLREVF